MPSPLGSLVYGNLAGGRSTAAITAWHSGRTADAFTTCTQYGYLLTDHELRIRDPKRGDLPKDLVKIRALMETRLAAMIGEDDEPLPDQETAYDKLSAEIAEIDALRTIVLPKKGAIVAAASIENDGSFDVELWFADRAAKGAELPKGGVCD